MADSPQLLKFDVCIFKKDDVPFEDFARWVKEEYPPKAVPIMKKHGIVQWAQVRIRRSLFAHDFLFTTPSPSPSYY
jgi:hypothetical protein